MSGEAGLGPWLWLAGLGAFHGLNPAMGWLFAVALGLHRGSRATVLLALAPIALGHALSIALVAWAAVALGIVLDPLGLRIAAAMALIGGAVFHAVRGHRMRVRVGMQAGVAGLALWSFLMAGTHGAGLMLVPALMPLCLGALSAGTMSAGAAALVSALAVGVHTVAMLAVTGGLAIAVFEWIGVGVLKRAWINIDLVWTAALALSAALVLWL